MTHFNGLKAATREIIAAMQFCDYTQHTRIEAAASRVFHTFAEQVSALSTKEANNG